LVIKGEKAEWFACTVNTGNLLLAAFACLKIASCSAGPVETVVLTILHNVAYALIMAG
jgi:hypothetical protein